MTTEDDELQLEDNGESARPINGTKLFNFDYLVSAKLDTVKRTQNLTNCKPHSIGMSWLDDQEFTDISLKRPVRYYLCGCLEYCQTYGEQYKDIHQCSCLIQSLDHRSNPDDWLVPLVKGEIVYQITTWLNRRRGMTSTQRWRQQCWNELEPTLRSVWDSARLERQRIEEAEFTANNMMVDEEGNIVPKIVKRGRKGSAEVLHLGAEEAAERIKLVQRYATYTYRLRQMMEANDSTMAVKMLALGQRCTEIYDRVQQLGGVPDSWVRYEVEVVNNAPPVEIKIIDEEIWNG